MKSWNRPEVPRLEGVGLVPAVHDTPSDSLVRASGPQAHLYVCGITPYDATHIGHAATYIAYDTLIRLWLDAGLEVTYVQNATDVDDPLLERATATGVDWRDLAAGQIELFRSDMESLAVIPPDHYIAVTERIDPIADAVQALLDSGTAYRLGDDVYFDNAAASASSPWHLGQESGLDRATMLTLFAERGGDPQREGKRDALDPLLWRGARAGEPSWPTRLGDGRPGWHIECSVIAQEFLELPLAVNGGGIDLAFPHHEFTAGHTAALSGHNLSEAFVHAALVGYQGEKMSKSLGNLVLVGKLVESGVDPRTIRLAVLAHHYRSGWEWTDAVLATAEARLASWVGWASGVDAGDRSIADELRSVLANDLGTPAALSVVDVAVTAGAPTPADLDAINALLGISLSGV